MSTELLQARKAVASLDQAVRLILRAVNTNNTIILWGKSGVGKSAVIEGLVDLVPDSFMRVVSLVSLESYDITGIPGLTKDSKGIQRTEFFDPTMIPLKGDELPNGAKRGFIFFDETPEGDESVLKAIYRVINERMVNNRRVHPDVQFICAGNPPSVGANSKDLLPTINNRIQHIEIKLDHKEWIAWAVKAGIDPIIRAFVGTHSQFLHNYDPKESGNAWSSPRSLTNLDKSLKGNPSMGVPALSLTDQDSWEMLTQPASFIGLTAGQALLDFASNNTLPAIKDILANPALVRYNELTPGQTMLLGQSLLSVADGDNIKEVLKVMEYLPADHKAINFMAFTKMPSEVLSAVLADPAFADFATKHSKLLNVIVGD